MLISQRQPLKFTASAAAIAGLEEVDIGNFARSKKL